MRLVAHDDRARRRRGCPPGAGRLLQHGVLADQRQQLLRVQLARQRPQPRPRAARTESPESMCSCSSLLNGRSEAAAADRIVAEAARAMCAGRRGCGRRRSPALAAPACMRSKSGLRNSCHSVTMASASAPSSASGLVLHRRVRAVAVDARAFRHRHRIVGAHPGARRHSASISTRLGASRMSSVFGLKASPQTAKVLPADRRNAP